MASPVALRRRPYFVMELVKGVPITEFCDKNHMPAEQRLKLFLDVCHAIQHAHHKGIIHRDIKPSNVMVTLHDGVPVVKVIDFGVAKATVQKLTEQHAVHGLRANDRHAGVHESRAGGDERPGHRHPQRHLLAGRAALRASDGYDAARYSTLTSSRLRRDAASDPRGRATAAQHPVVCSYGEPTGVSLRRSAEILAGNRGTDVRQLSRLLAGDLDWIVMKALDKDRNRRYGTPGNFAEDIERYMRREAILARPPTTAYRLKKFAQRNRAAVLTTATVVAALLFGTAVAIWQAVVATHARAIALEAADAEKKAKETAEVKEAETRAVLDFVEKKIFAAARPEGQDGGLGREVTLSRAVDAALPFVDKSFMNQPLIEARLRTTVGNSFTYMGDAKKAAEQYEQARMLYTRHRGPDHPDTLISMHNLAASYDDLGRLTEALKLREETLMLRKSKLGPDHPLTLTSMLALANSYFHLGRHAEALKLNEETLTIRKTTLGPDHAGTLDAMNNLAVSYASFGRHTDALRLHEETLALRRTKLGPSHPSTLLSMTNLANIYDALGRHEEALKLHEETLALRKRKLGPDHPSTFSSMANLANSYNHLGRHAEALKLHEETLALRKRKLGLEHPGTILSMEGLANSYEAFGRHAEALKLRDETLALEKSKLGPEHPKTLRSMHNLATSYAAVGRHAEALKLHEETLSLRETKLGPEHFDTVHNLNSLAWLLATVPDAKLREPQRAVEFASKAAGAAPTNAGYRGTLGVARYTSGDWKGAVADLEKAINLRKPDDPSRASEGFFLAMANWQLGQKDEARAWFDKSVAWMDKRKKDDAELKRFRAEAAELLGINEKP